MFHQMKNFLVVADPEGDIAITRADLMKYSGPRGLIASAVVLRLLDRAFFDLSPDQPPIRKDIKVLSSFPGSDVVDGIEFVTKAVYSGRYILDMDKASADAPKSPAGGAFYFEIAYRDKAFSYIFSPDIFDAEWFAQVKRNQEGCATEKEHADYVNYKFQVFGKLLTAIDPFFRIEPCKIDPRLKN